MGADREAAVRVLTLADNSNSPHAPPAWQGAGEGEAADAANNANHGRTNATHGSLP